MKMLALLLPNLPQYYRDDEQRVQEEGQSPPIGGYLFRSLIVYLLPQAKREMDFEPSSRRHYKTRLFSA